MILEEWLSEHKASSSQHVLVPVTASVRTPWLRNDAESVWNVDLLSRTDRKSSRVVLRDLIDTAENMISSQEFCPNGGKILSGEFRHPNDAPLASARFGHVRISRSFHSAGSLGILK